LVVIVVDASNLQRNLYFATQVIELGYPTLIALNMIDVAENNGHRVDAAKLAKSLGVPVAPIIASVGRGIDHLKGQILGLLAGGAEWPKGSQIFAELPALVSEEVEKLP
jgi:ferrous iron transport protein B